MKSKNNLKMLLGIVVTLVGSEVYAMRGGSQQEGKLKTLKIENQSNGALFYYFRKADESFLLGELEGALAIMDPKSKRDWHYPDYTGYQGFGLSLYIITSSQIAYWINYAKSSDSISVAELSETNRQPSLITRKSGISNIIFVIDANNKIQIIDADKLANRTYYDILGVLQHASSAEIKSAYHRLALQYHPDKAAASGLSQEEAQKKFTELKNAYEVLSDPAKRKAYDASR